MSPLVQTSTPPNTPKPIGPYNHIAKVGSFITIGGTAGVNPATGQLAGADIASQTMQILDSFKVMLDSVDSDLDHVIHINIFLKNMVIKCNNDIHFRFRAFNIFIRCVDLEARMSTLDERRIFTVTKDAVTTSF